MVAGRGGGFLVFDLHVSSVCLARVVVWQTKPPLLLEPPCADAEARHTGYVAASETPSWSLRAASMADLSCCSMQVSKSLTRCRNEARLGSNEQGRQADYDRLTALPLGAELGDVGCSAFDVSRWPRTCNGPRGLSLMAALQVNSGTAKEDARRKPRSASVRCANT